MFLGRHPVIKGFFGYVFDNSENQIEHLPEIRKTPIYAQPNSGKITPKTTYKLFQVDTKTTQHVPETTSAKRGAAAPQNQILVSRTTASAAMESADSSVTNVGILISSIEYGKIDLPYAWKGRPTYKPVANIHSKISPPHHHRP